jgi:hypothetical protein
VFIFSASTKHDDDDAKVLREAVETGTLPILPSEEGIEVCLTAEEVRMLEQRSAAAFGEQGQGAHGGVTKW